MMAFFSRCLSEGLCYGKLTLVVHRIGSEVVDGTLIRFHDPLVLRDGRFLSRKLLFWNRLLGHQRLVTGQIYARILEGRLIPNQLPPGLVLAAPQRGVWIDSDSRSPR
jgi:hypothetical protein